jgi:hypothetical protein
MEEGKNTRNLQKKTRDRGQLRLEIELELVELKPDADPATMAGA